MIDDADAERLAHVAAQFAARLRDDEPDSVARWLCAQLDGAERWQLLFMCGAMIPTDQTPAQLLSWFWDQRAQARARRIVAEMYGARHGAAR